MFQPVKNLAFKKVLKLKDSLVSEIGGIWHRCLHFVRQNWIRITMPLLSLGLISLIVCMLLSPLPERPAPNFADKQPVTSNVDQAGSLPSPESYTQLLKTRDLFKPSVPIPAEKKIGKTTAEQLAQRLQFLGTSGDGQNLSALVFIPERGPGSFQIGDRVAEFVLKDIRKDQLVLELEDELITLKR